MRINAKVFPRVKIPHAFIVLLLLTILSTAALVHLIWYRTASRNVEKVVAMLDVQSSATVGNELVSNLTVVSSTAEIVRSIFALSAFRPDEPMKFDSLFLSLMKEQPVIAWIGIAFPDGHFYGSHVTPEGKIERVEIGGPTLGKTRSLRRKVYYSMSGNLVDEHPPETASNYIAETSQWYRNGERNEQLAWSVVNTLPLGFEPAIVVSGKVRISEHVNGVVMVAVSLQRLSATLRSLMIPKDSKIFMLTRGSMVLATSGALDGVMIGDLNNFPTSDTLAASVVSAQTQEKNDSFRTLIGSKDLGPVFVSSNKLPFEDWRLVAAIPRATLAGDNDANSQRVIFVVLGIAILAAVMAIAFARILFARPLSRLAEQLHLIGRFELDAVRYRPTMLAELDDFSLVLKRMSNGLSAFARYLPIDVVRPLIDGNIEPKPGGELREITVLFADLPGFTELTEELGAGVEPSLTGFLTLSTAAIHAEGGTVDKFIGDAVMAIWNAPGDETNHALRACRAAAAIRASMHALPPMSPKHDAVRVRIGINTGVALVGNIGSTARLSYTAIGDVVNLASRLVGVAKDSGVEIVLTDETLGRTHGLFPVRALGPIRIRGKLEPVSVYTIDCHPKAMPEQ
ncbi:adenylate/guanylate cyclase domain-containing protein [Pararhizobium sp. DWP3-4]|uniref:adenylate/guanylate cyclase domain-containing protein n=1 Tax=Pararhizobium sp. DWP3-4 TaxID=2804565 RepID=UPI003CF5B6C6